MPDLITCLCASFSALVRARLHGWLHLSCVTAAIRILTLTKRTTARNRSVKMLPPDSSELIDWSILGQILEMDDDENEREFSKGIVENYFEQAETTFLEMDEAVAKNDMDKLMRLGHFLKGSSASLGLTKVQNTCEEIHFLNSSDYSIADLMATVRQEYAEAKARLIEFFYKQ